jgi:hypothetical protein
VGVLVGWFARAQASPESQAAQSPQQDPNATELVHKGKSARAWVQQLQDKNLDNRLEAARALLEIGNGVKPHASGVETAIKSASWDIFLLIGEAASEPVVFTSFALPPTRSSYATEQQYQKAVLEYNQHIKKSEELIKERQEKKRQLDVKVEKHLTYLAALVTVLEKADPERLSAMGLPAGKAQRFVDAMKPKPEHTFTTVSNTIGGNQQGGSFGQVQSDLALPSPNGKSKLPNPKKQ